MYNLKAFITAAALENNQVGQNAPLCELSTRSRTYSKEKGFYTDADYLDVGLVSFTSVRTTTPLSGPAVKTLITVPVSYSSKVLHLASWVYTQSIGGDITSNKQLFELALLAEFGTVGEEFIIGDMVTDGTQWMPEFVSWSVTGTGEENRMKIWFSDSAFQNQYDDFEIIVVPPISDISIFFSDYDTVKAEVEDHPMSDILQRAQTAAGVHPFTLIRTEDYEWIEPNVDTNRLMTGWTLIIYGQAGNNLDHIRNALIAYIGSNDAHSQVQWTAILPSLFKTTEFIITPLWDQYSVPNRTLAAGMYSPTTLFTKMLDLAKTTAVGYPEAHVEANLTISGTMYKSLSFLSVGGPDNLDGIHSFDLRFIDYAVLPTTSLDFDRISPDTQDWILKFIETLVVAEEATEFSDIPVSMTRVKRGNVLYITMGYLGVQYLVVTKNSITDPDDPDEVEVGFGTP